MGWTPTQQCLDNIKAIGPGARVCNDPKTHCEDVQDITHKMCQCQPPWQGNCHGDPPQPPGCCTFTGNSPMPSYDNLGLCFCCCSCFTYGTPVAVDDKGAQIEFKAIEQFVRGDLVLAAGEDLSWKQAVVEFSDGTGSESMGTPVVLITYDLGGEEHTLFATNSQPFLIPGSNLIGADKLKPGDLLVTADNQTTTVTQVVLGTFTRPVHHISTSLEPATSLKGHLLNVNGVVAGDFSLQMSGIAGVQLAEFANNDELPSLGSREYMDANKALMRSSTHAALASHATREIEIKHFRALDFDSSRVPENAAMFVTADQSWELQQSPEKQPASSTIGRDAATYLIKLYGAIYPAITFNLDLRNDAPNVYAFEEYGRKFVVITGGLIRMTPLKFEGIALVMAHGIGRLVGGPPLDREGRSCVGQADYAAVGGVMMNVWFGMQWGQITWEGIKQVKALFGLISNEGSVDTCLNPTLDCRLSAMDAALRTLPLPECAGGPKKPFLQVTGAVAKPGPSPNSELVTVSFNADVDPQTALVQDNYSFVPQADVQTVNMDAQHKDQVTLTVSLDPQLDYVVIVNDVLSAKHEPILSGKNRAKVVR